jgi:hypothetical protein
MSGEVASGPPEATSPASPADAAPPAEGMAGRLAPVLANLGALTALLVYFGWRRSETQAQLLGIDESVFGMTTQEYVLRSVGPVFGLLAVLGAVGLLWLWIDHWIDRMVSGRPRALRWVSRGLAVGWPLPVLATYEARYRWDALAYVAFPLAIAAALSLVLYRVHLNQRYGTRRLSHYHVLRGLVALCTAACLFWSASNYAEVLGGALADQFAATFPDKVRVVVYSSEPLHLDAPGVRTEVLGEDRTAWRYRYSGLRLMEHTGGKYFLVSDEWTLDRGNVIVLRDDERIRLEFVHG